MGKIGYIVRRELDFIFRSRKVMAFYCIIFPLIIFGLLVAIFSAKVIVEVPIAVVDNSKSYASRELIRTLDASHTLNVKYHPLDHKEAEKLLERGQAYAVINIEHNFERDLLNLKGANVGAFINNQYMLVSGNASKAILAAVDDFSAKYKTKLYLNYQVPQYAMEAYMSPLSVSENTLFNPYMNYIYFLVLGAVPAILQMFVVLSIVYSLLSELKTGRAKEIRRIIAQNPLRIVNAKIFVYMLLYMCVLTVMLITLLLFFDLPLNGHILIVFAGGAAFLLMTATTGVLIAGCTNSLRMGLSSAAVYSAPAFAYYGVSFPVEAMPMFARVWAEILPGTHYNRILVNEILRGANTWGSVKEILFMFAVSMLFLYLGSKLYSRWTADEKHWGPKI
ncbi:ABC-2 type transport system permease protein [Elusimicrobium simillimum]|uniref:ABC transporter permease n=1 Tax=Elusimicrobium simillimum TaxID=3143438 RepID=UPI003C7011E7